MMVEDDVVKICEIRRDEFVSRILLASNSGLERTSVEQHAGAREETPDGQQDMYIHANVAVDSTNEPETAPSRGD